MVSLTHPSYAMSHSLSMPYRIIRSCIVRSVKPHELVKKLVDKAGGEGPVARAMGMRTFQGTLLRDY